MAAISETEFDRLLRGFERESLHLETRDAYGTETELPYMAKWARGEPDDLSWLANWCATLRSYAEAGATVRRARIVSEPLSAYQRWSYSIAHPMVDAGGCTGCTLSATSRVCRPLALVLGVLTACAWLPSLLISLPARVWADQADRKPVMQAANVASAVLPSACPSPRGSAR